MKITRLAALAGFAVVGGAQAQTITQSTTQTISPGSSVSCNAGGITADNQYYRGFELFADHGIAGPWVVSSVEFGVEAALAGSGGVQPMTVNLYDGFVRTATTLTPGALIGTAGTLVADGSGFFHSVAVSGVVTSGFLAVEISVPDSTGTGGAGHSFFLGANGDGQLHDSYLSSTACGLPGPTGTSTGAIGFPGSMWVMNVTGAPVPEPASMIALSMGAAALLRKRRSSK